MPIKETYKYVKNKLKNINVSKVTNLTIDNVHLNDTHEIVNAFHEHFMKIYEPKASSFPLD
jgi:hypothetical protein